MSEVADRPIQISAFHYSKKRFRDDEYRKEFDRQLKIQEKGLNELTIAEYLKNREKYVERKNEKNSGRAKEGNKVQQQAREKAFTKKLKELRRTNPELSRNDRKTVAREWLSKQDALHLVDQIAGGDPTKIAGVGDLCVNRSIGAQWGRDRASELESKILAYIEVKEAAIVAKWEGNAEKIEVELNNFRKSKLNVKLTVEEKHKNKSDKFTKNNDIEPTQAEKIPELQQDPSTLPDQELVDKIIQAQITEKALKKQLSNTENPVERKALDAGIKQAFQANVELHNELIKRSNRKDLIRQKEGIERDLLKQEMKAQTKTQVKTIDDLLPEL